ncbi:hypothetical protein ACDH70_14245 [Xanthomonas axonopodis pv. poinsettiicola]|uniref:hypothetical protein n=1 Tax=Xanthomonas TaxID=338 RepID=UPI001E3806CD|nr:hypothetical protein [Xanthomonas codiaei]MCC8535565.1 hypothetical protein [Xanthomonas codiaei]
MYQVALVDLDDTLFSSLRKQKDAQALQPAALSVDGGVVSYTSPRQRAFAQWLQRADLVVPVTARTLDTFARVLLRFDGPAIVAHGATIVDAQRQVDPVWAATVHARMQTELPALQQLQQALSAQFGAALEVSIAGAPQQPAYLVAREPSRDEQVVRRISDEVIAPWVAQHPGYTHHVNGRNLAVLPPCVDKRLAVAYLLESLRRQHGELFVVGAGDSITDLPFLSLCDVAILPTGSQAWAQLRTHAHEPCA